MILKYGQYKNLDTSDPSIPSKYLQYLLSEAKRTYDGCKAELERRKEPLEAELYKDHHQQYWG